MLLIGSSYKNNLVNLIGFFMLSLVLISMIQTNSNLRHLRLKGLFFDFGPEDGPIVFKAHVHNSSRTSRRRVQVTPYFESTFVSIHPAGARFDVDNRATSVISGTLSASQRGVYQCTKARLSTTYPLGLFYAWTWQDCDGEAVVYPKPEGIQELPDKHLSTLREGGANATTESIEDFQGHHLYRTGESHRRIDWKAFARGRPLLTKEFDGTGGTGRVLAWDMTPPHSSEKRLRQLAYWVQICQQNRISFRLELPDRTTAPGSSQHHLLVCLRALAEFNAEHPEHHKNQIKGGRL